MPEYYEEGTLIMKKVGGHEIDFKLEKGYLKYFNPFINSFCSQKLLSYEKKHVDEMINSLFHYEESEEENYNFLWEGLCLDRIIEVNLNYVVFTSRNLLQNFVFYKFPPPSSSFMGQFF